MMQLSRSTVCLLLCFNDKQLSLALTLEQKIKLPMSDTLKFFSDNGLISVKEDKRVLFLGRLST